MYVQGPPGPPGKRGLKGRQGPSGFEGLGGPTGQLGPPGPSVSEITYMNIYSVVAVVNLKKVFFCTFYCRGLMVLWASKGSRGKMDQRWVCHLFRVFFIDKYCTILCWCVDICMFL